jgi:outer membrane murein-binding lipoprotein Lpp
MAKQEIHNWMRTAILLMGIVFAGGGYAMKISDNSTRVEKVESKVHTLEINQEREIALKESLLTTLIRLEGKVDGLATEIGPIKTGIEIMEVKYDTLTKD